MPHALLGDVRGARRGIAKREADPLFSELFLCYGRFARVVQEFLEFWIGFVVAKKLFTIRHDSYPTFRFLFEP